MKTIYYVRLTLASEYNFSEDELRDTLRQLLDLQQVLSEYEMEVEKA